MLAQCHAEHCSANNTVLYAERKTEMSKKLFLEKTGSYFGVYVCVFVFNPIVKSIKFWPSRLVQMLSSNCFQLLPADAAIACRTP